MDIIRNIWRRAIFNLKRHFVCPTVQPVLWGKIKLKSYPSTNLWFSLPLEGRLRLANLIKEIELFSRCYCLFPKSLSDNDWKRLLKLENIHERKDYLKFCKKNEEKKKSEKLKKELKKISRSAEVNSSDEVSTQYFNEGFIYMRFSSVLKYEKQNEDMRSLRSILLNPYPLLVIDCRFLDRLSLRALSLTVLQINYLIADNAKRKYPWPIYLCNIDMENADVYEALHKHKCLQIFSKCLNVVTTSRNYTELFPSYNIVYLSPHADEEIENIDGSEVFILGGIVDRVKEHRIDPQASLVAATEDSVMARKLPLSRFIRWKAGPQYLTLTAVSSILYDAYENSNGLERAIQNNIPVRNTSTMRERNKESIKRRHEMYREYDNNVIDEIQQRLRI